METDIRRLAVCDETARNATLHSKATCPKVKSTIETDSDDITVVTPRTRIRVLRENTEYLCPFCITRSNRVWCACAERNGGPNARSFRSFREDVSGARVSTGKKKISTIRIADPKCTGVITVTLKAMTVISQR